MARRWLETYRKREFAQLSPASLEARCRQLASEAVEQIEETEDSLIKAKPLPTADYMAHLRARSAVRRQAEEIAIANVFPTT